MQRTACLHFTADGDGESLRSCSARDDAAEPASRIEHLDADRRAGVEASNRRPSSWRLTRAFSWACISRSATIDRREEKIVYRLDAGNEKESDLF